MRSLTELALQRETVGDAVREASPSLTARRLSADDPSHEQLARHADEDVSRVSAMSLLSTARMYLRRTSKLDQPTDIYDHRVKLLDGGELDLAIAARPSHPDRQHRQQVRLHAPVRGAADAV